ncbi:MAG: cell division protein SepF [Defluviitaleaceae bacterium]|nr:cell division protein SepF [Defluviitaleaceae bacterium]
MKGIWNKIDAILGGDLDDNDDEYYYDDSYPSDDDDIDIAPAPTKLSSRGDKDGRRRPNNVREFYADRTPQDEGPHIRITSPKAREDATLICDYLRDNKICIVNMTDTEPNIAQHIADWLGGMCYALNGQVERIDNRIFLLAPENAKISSDLMADIKGGLFKSFK